MTSGSRHNQVLRFNASTSPEAIVQKFTDGSNRIYRALQLRSVVFKNLYELESCLLQSRPFNVRDEYPTLLVEAPRIKHFRQPAEWMLDDKDRKAKASQKRGEVDHRPLTLKDVQNVDLKYWKHIFIPFIDVSFHNTSPTCHKNFPFQDDFTWARNLQRLSFINVRLHSTTLFKVLLASCPQLKALTLVMLQYDADKTLAGHAFPSRDEFASDGHTLPKEIIYLEELIMDDLNYGAAEDILAWFGKMHSKRIISLARLKIFRVHVYPFDITPHDELMLDKYRQSKETQRAQTPIQPRRAGSSTDGTSYGQPLGSQRARTPMPGEAFSGNPDHLMPLPEPYGTPSVRLRGGALPSERSGPDGFTSGYPWTPQHSPPAGMRPEECPVHIHENDLISAFNFPALLLVERIRLDSIALSFLERLAALTEQLKSGPSRLQKLVVYVRFTREPQSMIALDALRQQSEWNNFCALSGATVDMWLETSTVHAFIAIEQQIGIGPPINFVRRIEGEKPLPIPGPGDLALPSMAGEHPPPELSIRSGGKEAVVNAYGYISQSHFPDLQQTEKLIVKTIPSKLVNVIETYLDRLDFALSYEDAIEVQELVIVVDIEKAIMDDGATTKQMLGDLQRRPAIWKRLQDLYMKRLPRHFTIQIQHVHQPLTDEMQYVKDAEQYLKKQMVQLTRARVGDDRDPNATPRLMFNQAMPGTTSPEPLHIPLRSSNSQSVPTIHHSQSPTPSPSGSGYDMVPEAATLKPNAMGFFGPTSPTVQSDTSNAYIFRGGADAPPDANQYLADPGPMDASTSTYAPPPPGQFANPASMRFPTPIDTRMPPMDASQSTYPAYPASTYQAAEPTPIPTSFYGPPGGAATTVSEPGFDDVNNVGPVADEVQEGSDSDGMSFMSMEPDTNVGPTWSPRLRHTTLPRASSVRTTSVRQPSVRAPSPSLIESDTTSETEEVLERPHYADVAPSVPDSDLVVNWNDLPDYMRLAERVKQTFQMFAHPAGSKGVDELHMGSFFKRRKISDYPDVALMKTLTLDTLPQTTVEQIELLTDSLEQIAHQTASPVRLRRVCIMIHYRADSFDAPAVWGLVKDRQAWHRLAQLLSEEKFRHLRLRVHVVASEAEEVRNDLEAWLEQETGTNWLTTEVTIGPWANL